MRTTPLALALAGAALAGSATPALAVTWTATPTTDFRVFQDGTTLGRDELNRTVVHRADGESVTVPAGWDVVGARAGGDVFLVRRYELQARDSADADPHPLPSYQNPGTSIARYAWLGRGGSLTTVTVKPLGRPVDLWPGIQPERRALVVVNTAAGFGVEPVWESVDSVQPDFDGSALTNEATGGDGADNGWPLAPWEPALVASNGRVLGTDGSLSLVWNRIAQVFAMAPTGGAAIVWRSDPKAVRDTISVEFRGATASGQALMVRSSQIPPAAGSLDLVADPGGPVASCEPGRTVLARVADDGSFMDGGCMTPGDGGPRAITMRAGIFGPTTWQWSGTPILAAAPLLGGMVSGWRTTAEGDRAVLLVGGREIDPTTAMASAGIGRVTAVSNVSPAGDWFVSTATGRFILSKRSVFRGALATIAGAPAANVPVTVDDPSTPAAPATRVRRVVRTDKQGRFSITTTAALVRLSVPAPACLASPSGGCATSVSIATGFDRPPVVVGLKGAGAAQAAVAAGVAGAQRLVVRKGGVAVSLRCLRAKACTGAAVMRARGKKAKLATGQVRLGALATGSVALRLTKAGAKAFGKKAKPARVSVVVGGRTVVVRVTVRR